MAHFWHSKGAGPRWFSPSHHSWPYWGVGRAWPQVLPGAPGSWHTSFSSHLLKMANHPANSISRLSESRIL